MDTAGSFIVSWSVTNKSAPKRGATRAMGGFFLLFTSDFVICKIYAFDFVIYLAGLGGLFAEFVLLFLVLKSLKSFRIEVRHILYWEVSLKIEKY